MPVSANSKKRQNILEKKSAVFKLRNCTCNFRIFHFLRDFRSADEDIEMVSLEDFYANAPPSISQEEITRKDKHRQHLARLNWEMEERKKYYLIIKFSKHII